MRGLRRSNLIQFICKLVRLYRILVVLLSYLWNFGAFAGIVLAVQIVTGVGLAFWYIPSVELAFSSVEFIMREVAGGWWLRYLHANGASLFFVVVYLHIARGVFYGSYTKSREKVWYSGVVIFILMILTAFLGYVLSWADELLGGDGYHFFAFCNSRIGGEFVIVYNPLCILYFFYVYKFVRFFDYLFYENYTS